MKELSDRQREIVEASIHLISVGGIQELTIKNLAAKIEVSEPALYRHFKSKQDILLALLNFFKQNQKSHYVRVTSAEPSPFKAIQIMIKEGFRNFSTKPAMVTVIFAEGMFQNNLLLSRQVYSIMDDRREHFAHLIGAGQALGEIRKDIDKDQLTLIVMGSMRLILTRWRLSQFTFDLVKEGDRYLATLKKLLK